MAVRLERQQLLFDPERRFSFVLAERVLRWSPGTGALAGQAERIASIATLANVDVAVLTESADPDVRLMHGFILGDPIDPSESTSVRIELHHGSQQVTDPGSVAVYEDIWRKVTALAVTGEEAVALIRAAM